MKCVTYLCSVRTCHQIQQVRTDDWPFILADAAFLSPTAVQLQWTELRPVRGGILFGTEPLRVVLVFKSDRGPHVQTGPRVWVAPRNGHVTAEQQREQVIVTV